MCGLTGFLGAPGNADHLNATVHAMSDALVHRGPDDDGQWVDGENGIALGFRRLAIVDLSEAGHQPMTSASGRYVIVFNGEVYNFERIRTELRNLGVAPPFRGHSDTEVMLAAIEAWGLESAVQRFIGMFAFALWDRRERRLHLVRDRMGVKPMYYGFAGSTFLFGSELKALRRHPDFRAEIDRDAAAGFLRSLYVPAPLSIYRGIRKQIPGTIVSLSPDSTDIRTTTWWSAAQAAATGTANRYRGSEQDAVGELDALLRDAISMRMVADVPLGVFLSGGIDSSLVTALMQAQTTQPVQTFTIGFTEGNYNEAQFAADIARHLGTSHTELYVSPDDAMNVIPKLPTMYDEPFADSSQIPTHLVALLASRHVTVSLSGEGGDEVFGGYRRYFEGERVLRTFGRIPTPLRQALGRGISAVPSRAWDRMLRWREPQGGTQMSKLARVLTSRSLDSLYADIVMQWDGDIVLGGTAPPMPGATLEDPVERMMLLDQVSVLPDDILTKVDRATMAASLEAREPLLDHRVVELAWSLPRSMKVQGGRGKKILRAVLDRYVPRTLIDRPKMGFKVPIDTWLRGPLCDWAESLLDERALREQELLDPTVVRTAWREFLDGDSKRSADAMWAVLMLQAWMAAG